MGGEKSSRLAQSSNWKRGSLLEPENLCKDVVFLLGREDVQGDFQSGGKCSSLGQPTFLLEDLIPVACSIKIEWLNSLQNPREESQKSR